MDIKKFEECGRLFTRLQEAETALSALEHLSPSRWEFCSKKMYTKDIEVYYLPQSLKVVVLNALKSEIAAIYQEIEEL